MVASSASQRCKVSGRWKKKTRRARGTGSAWSQNRSSLLEATYSNRACPSRWTKSPGPSAMSRAASSANPDNAAPAGFAAITPHKSLPTKSA